MFFIIICLFRYWPLFTVNFKGMGEVLGSRAFPEFFRSGCHGLDYNKNHSTVQMMEYLIPYSS